MSGLWRWLKRALFALPVLVVGLLAPVGYVETMCRSAVIADNHVPIVAPADRRPEARTLLTYPEWRIVHAYDDYAEVIRLGDPHEFGFLRAIAGFWTSLCSLSKAAGEHGGVDWPTKQMVYTIGVSFTAELLSKAGYEETLGRAATWLRGKPRASLDDLSALQASAYATFLQQVPWYRWDFAGDQAALQSAPKGVFRDRERAFALGFEYRVKAAYAGLIATAVAGMEPDALRMRVIVTGMTPKALAQVPQVKVIGTRPQGTEIETPRYRAFTDLAKVLATQGVEFVEIAGNDDIIFTTITDGPSEPGALHQVMRQGNTGFRQLMLVKVTDLAAALRDPALRVEHIHDY